EDSPVGGQRLCLFERAGIGAWHVEDAPARADRHWCASPAHLQPTVGATAVPLSGRWVRLQETCGWRGSTAARVAGLPLSSGRLATTASSPLMRILPTCSPHRGCRRSSPSTFRSGCPKERVTAAAPPT